MRENPQPQAGSAHKGTFYFARLVDARGVAQSVGGRVVDFERGYAVQFHESGPYYGDLSACPGCRWCPQDNLSTTNRSNEP